MTLKTLVTGVATAAAVAGAAVGVTSVASPAIAAADDCVDPGTLQGVLNALVDPNVAFYPGKEGLIQGGIGRITGKYADGKLKSAYATGALPVAFQVSPPVCAGNQATSTVSAGAQNMQLTFVNDGNWKLSAASAAAIQSAFG